MFKKSLILALTLVVYSEAASINGKIVGGQDAKEGQFPYHVSIRVLEKHNCGGSILDEWTIITAAHCLNGLEVEDITIMAGSIKLSVERYVYEAKTLIINENYNPFEFANDIGLIILKEKMIYVEGLVAPIELNKQELTGGEDVTLQGWGTTVVGGSTPDDLQWIDLIVLDQDTCQKDIGYPTLTNGHICTFTKEGEGACHGDSGSCLVYDGKCCGIVNFGRPCAVGYPDVFARVSNYLEWIEENRYKTSV